jgi:tetratricopeptide (TPR) repeat protein
MMLRRACIALLLAVTVSSGSRAWAGSAEAAKAFEEGLALLAKGNFDGALKAYKTAAEGDPDKKEYMLEYTLLRRIIKQRAQLTTEQDTEAWLKVGRAVYAFYDEHGLNEEALTLAAQIHEKHKDADSAERLAGAQLAAGKNNEVASLIEGMPADQRTPYASVLQGIALARIGKTDDARAIADKFEPAKDTGARVLFDAARLNALVKNDSKALDLLKSAFEATPAPALDDLRAQAKAAKEFERLASSDGFATALKTESKVKAACGTKEACGKCPEKGKHGAGACPESGGEKPAKK